MVWLTHGPEPARKWAELTGMSSPAVLLDNPAKQAALEKVLKECKPSTDLAVVRQAPATRRRSEQAAHSDVYLFTLCRTTAPTVSSSRYLLYVTAQL